jgi:hypothetical protein
MGLACCQLAILIAIRIQSLSAWWLPLRVKKSVFSSHLRPQPAATETEISTIPLLSLILVCGCEGFFYTRTMIRNNYKHIITGGSMCQSRMDH